MHMRVSLEGVRRVSLEGVRREREEKGCDVFVDRIVGVVGGSWCTPDLFCGFAYVDVPRGPLV